MFSGRHILKKLSDGKIFIDRDPNIFIILIKYLRSGCEYPFLADKVDFDFNSELNFWGLKNKN